MDDIMEELKARLNLDTSVHVGSRRRFPFDDGLLRSPMEQHKILALSPAAPLLRHGYPVYSPIILQGDTTFVRRTMEEPDSPVGSISRFFDNHSASQWKTGPTGTKVSDATFTSLDFIRLWLRKISRGIDPKDGRQEGVSMYIKRLEQDLSGLLSRVSYVKPRALAHDHPFHTQHMDRFGELLDEILKGVCLDFLRVSHGPHASLILNSILSKNEGPKWISHVQRIIGIIMKHLQSKREEISEDKFLSMIKSGPVQTWYIPNRVCLELNVIPHTGGLYFTRVEWHTSVRNKLVQLLLFVDWSGMEGHGVFPTTLQIQEVKDPACYVSRTIAGTGGDIIPPYAGRLRPVGTLKKRRQRVLTTGSSSATPYYITQSGHRLGISKRSIGLSTDNGSFHPLDSPLWIHDTGSSFSMTGDPSLLRGVHDATEIRSRGVNGAELVSTKCGRVTGAVNLSGVRYFPGAKANLISGGLFGSLGCEIIQNAKGCTIMKGGQVIGGGRLLPNRTYSVDFLDDKLLGATICSNCRHY